MHFNLFSHISCRKICDSICDRMLEKCNAVRGWVDVHFSYFELKVTVAVDFSDQLKKPYLPLRFLASACFDWQPRQISAVLFSAKTRWRVSLCLSRAPLPSSRPLCLAHSPQNIAINHAWQQRPGDYLSIWLCLCDCVYLWGREAGRASQGSNEKLH